MLKNINRALRKSYINSRGWKTKRKLLIIESDDWGSICIPDRKTYNTLLKKGLPVDQNRYNKFDTLERPEDLKALFDVLNKHKDSKGKPAVFTAVSLVANPDFEKIREDKLKIYHRKSIFETYKDFGIYNEMKQLWDQGIQEGIFYPQYHGLEHFHPSRWLRAVNSSKEERICFDYNGMPGVELDLSANAIKYRASFQYETEEEKQEIERDTKLGLEMFEEVFGFKSLSFCASQSIYGDHINPILFDQGVRCHQNGAQMLPKGEANNKKKNHYWGAMSPEGLTYWRRNANFEPSKSRRNWVADCLWEIDNAFKFGKPAVISSHRVNFMGALDETNRNESLKKLDSLLGRALKTWPELEFIHSETLGKIILDSRNIKNNNG